MVVDDLFYQHLLTVSVEENLILRHRYQRLDAVENKTNKQSEKSYVRDYREFSNNHFVNSSKLKLYLWSLSSSRTNFLLQASQGLFGCCKKWCTLSNVRLHHGGAAADFLNFRTEQEVQVAVPVAYGHLAEPRQIFELKSVESESGWNFTQHCQQNAYPFRLDKYCTMLRSLAVVRKSHSSATRKKCLTCNSVADASSANSSRTSSSWTTDRKMSTRSMATTTLSTPNSDFSSQTTSQALHGRSYSTAIIASRLQRLPYNNSIMNNNNNDNNNNNSYQHNYHVRYKVFVSKYNTALDISADQILQLLSQGGMSPTKDTRITTTHVQVRECPFCPKPTGGKPDNQFKMYVQIGGGCYFCHRCGASGSWFDLKKQLGCFDVTHVEDEGLELTPTITSTATSPGASASTLSAKFGAGKNGRSNAKKPLVKEDPSKSKYAGVSAEILSNITAPTASDAKECLPMPSPRLAACYITHLLDKPIDETPKALEYLLEKRGLQKTTLRKYGVGLAHYNFPSNEPDGGYVQQPCITFPWIMQASEVDFQESLRGARYKWDGDRQKMPDLSLPAGPHVTRRIKARAISNKAWQRLDPPGGGWGLFGMHTVPLESKEVVITEGEYDAMAVYQATGRPAVSLPNGCRSLPHEILPMLERFDKIYLWMDSDAPGQEGAEQFARKIGVNRCRLVRPSPQVNDNGESIAPPKDANEALLRQMDLEQMISSADTLPHEQILRFSDLRSHVMHEVFHPDKYVGAAVPSLPSFTGLIKGFRRGELTVLTGPTGSGKVRKRKQVMPTL